MATQPLFPNVLCVLWLDDKMTISMVVIKLMEVMRRTHKWIHIPAQTTIFYSFVLCLITWHIELFLLYDNVYFRVKLEI